MRVWWIPQVGADATFYVPVETVEEAMDIAKKNHKSMKKKNSIKTEIKTKEVPEWLNKNIEASSATDEEIQAMEEMLKGYE